MQRLKQLVWEWRDLRRCSRLVGWRVALLSKVVEGCKPICDALGVAAPAPVLRTRLRGITHAVAVRLGTTDIRVLRQVFEEHEYAPLDGLRLRTIIDCGAYAGFSALYFANRFPGARILAVEPDRANAALFRRNLAPYGDQVTLIEAAVWSDSSPLAVVAGEYRDGGAWATYVRSPAAGDNVSVRGIDVPALLALCATESVDLLKVDIEGSELTVFGTGARRWLPRIRNIAIELHGGDCEQTFFSALEPFDYQRVSSGELTLCLGLQSNLSTAAEVTDLSIPLA